MSHHPPSAAHHVFSKNGWSLWQEITISSKFRGKYLSIMPLGEPGLCPPRAETFWIRGRVFPHPEASLEPPRLSLQEGSLPSGALEPPWPGPFPSVWHGMVGPSLGSHDHRPCVLPPGAIHLEFQASGNHYVWRKSTSTVHNIIVGKLWIDQVRGALGSGGLAWGSAADHYYLSPDRGH